MSDSQDETKWWTYLETYTPFLYKSIDGCLWNSRKCPPPSLNPIYWVLYNFLTVRRYTGETELFYSKCVETHCSQKMVLKPIWVSAGWSVGDVPAVQYMLVYLSGHHRVAKSRVNVHPKVVNFYLSNILMPTGKWMSMADWCIGNC